MERRGRIGAPSPDAVLLVQLVGELVQHDVVPVVDVRGARHHAVPGQDHHVARPRFAQAGLRRLIGEAMRRSAPARHEIGRRIDQDGDEARVVVRLAVKEQHAGLRGDRDADLVGDRQAAAPFEALLGQEDLYVAQELLPILERQARRVGDVLLDDRAPLSGKGTASDGLSPPTFEPPEHGGAARLGRGAGPRQGVVKILPNVRDQLAIRRVVGRLDADARRTRLWCSSSACSGSGRAARSA